MTCRGLLAPSVAAQPFGRLASLNERPYRLEGRVVRHELILQLGLKMCKRVGDAGYKATSDGGWVSQLCIGATHSPAFFSGGLKFVTYRVLSFALLIGKRGVKHKFDFIVTSLSRSHQHFLLRQIRCRLSPLYPAHDVLI